MADWLSSMQQTFEYYVVDPATWKDSKRLTTVKSCTIDRDSTVETLGSATIDTTEVLDECYIRAYLITIQNGITERHPLGTFLAQPAPSSFDGRVNSVSMDGYTPLIELKENPPPLGYSVLKNSNIMDTAYQIAREQLRAPVVSAINTEKLYKDFIANTNDTWLTFLIDLISNAKYEFALDELGRVLFSPKQELESLQPVWTYDDGDKSILYQDVSTDRDIYGIPNVVEVVYSDNTRTYYARVVNDDPNSPVSTVSRGREILHRDTNPSFGGAPNEDQVKEYAERLLKELSSIEYKITYTHGYCPVRLGDCVRLNYERAGLTDIKAKVISQKIKCTGGCQVTEKAVFTTKLWR